MLLSQFVQYLCHVLAWFEVCVQAFSYCVVEKPRLVNALDSRPHIPEHVLGIIVYLIILKKLQTIRNISGVQQNWRYKDRVLIGELPESLEQLGKSQEFRTSQQTDASPSPKIPVTLH